MRKLSSRSFIMIIFLAFMAYQSIASGRYGDFGGWLQSTLLRIPGIVIGITVHEFAHAYSAWRLGDATPKLQGRVTLNPLAHIDPVGIITLLFIGFGWGRPVQVNPYAFRKNLRLSNIITDVAGVVTNFIVAFLCGGLLIALWKTGMSSSFGYALLLNIVYMNLVLMIFNLLPIPPLDGFGIITEIFDFRRYAWYQPFYNNGTIILLLLIVMPSNIPQYPTIISALLGPSLTAILSFIETIWFHIL